MSEPLHTPYGFCPQCGSPGSTRERRPNGNDRCFNGHIYPTVAAVLVKTKGLDECRSRMGSSGCAIFGRMWYE